MPVVPIYLNIDDKTYQGIKAGTLELYGLAKNANTKRVLQTRINAGFTKHFCLFKLDFDNLPYAEK